MDTLEKECVQFSNALTLVEGGSRLQITIAECSQYPAILGPPGWVCQEHAWPAPEWFREKERLLAEPSNAGLTLRGPVLHGQPRQPTVAEPPVQRHWVELVLRLRGSRPGTRVSTTETWKPSSNP